MPPEHVPTGPGAAAGDAPAWRTAGCWTHAQVCGFLDATPVPIRLACASATGWPSLLSLWFVRDEDGLWCATRPGAKVVRMLRAEPRCGFEISTDTSPYRGVRGQATARVVPERGADVLRRLVHRYQGGEDTPLARWLLSRSATEVALHIRPHSVWSWDFSQRMGEEPGVRSLDAAREERA